MFMNWYKRAQLGGGKNKLIVERGGEIVSSPGEAGQGVYAFIPTPSMREYYTSRGEELHQIELDQNKVVDLTSNIEQAKLLAFAKDEVNKLAIEIQGYVPPKINSSNIQRFGRIIEQYILQNHPDSDAYIIGHRGQGIPMGKQVIIHNMSAARVLPQLSPIDRQDTMEQIEVVGDPVDESNSLDQIKDYKRLDKVKE